MQYVYLAGIGNSADDHWQRSWFGSLANSLWVEHSDWHQPDCQLWSTELEQALRAVSEPFVIIAHSLGCWLFTHWLSTTGHKLLAGAFLVAVPDRNGANFPPQAVGWDRITVPSLSAPSVVISSSNDPYGSSQHVLNYVERLGANLVEIGAYGHINGQSNLGAWPLGKEIFLQLLSDIERGGLPGA
jgi:predicted alpha/beta hydrolase family esterase